MSDDKSKVQHFTSASFKKSLEDAGDTPVFVDFYADWCGPCQMAEPIINDLADEYDGKAVIAKLNIDENQEVAQENQVMSIPTVIIYKNGEAVDRMTGFAGRDGYVKLLEKAIEA